MKTGSLLLRDLRDWPIEEARQLLCEYTQHVESEIVNLILGGVQANCTCLADQCQKLLRERRRAAAAAMARDKATD